MKVLGIVRICEPRALGNAGGKRVGSVGSGPFRARRHVPEERIRAEQELTRRYAAIMPFWIRSAVASSVLAALLSRGSAGFRSTLLGAACFVAMLVSTRLGNVPINNRVLEIDLRRTRKSSQGCGSAGTDCIRCA